MHQMLDVFSGLGGFSLAASWTGAIETVSFVEIEPFCQAVLRKHWPDVPIINRIEETNGQSLLDRGIARPWIITGGVPCQPASLAGQRKGEADSRWLWDEFLRLVSELRPVWVLAENPIGIASLKGKNMDWILDQLETAGYEVQAFLVSAANVGATHLRERVWIVGYSDGERLYRQQAAEVCTGRNSSQCAARALADTDETGRLQPGRREPGAEFLRSSERRSSDVVDDSLRVRDGSGNAGKRGRRKHSNSVGTMADAEIERERELSDRQSHENQSAGRACCNASGTDCELADAQIVRRSTHEPGTNSRRPQKDEGENHSNTGRLSEFTRHILPVFPPGRNDFRSWASVAVLDASLMPCVEREVLRLDDGVSTGLVRRRRSARNAALKAYGNTIVPYCAYLILQGIADIERGRK